MGKKQSLAGRIKKVFGRNKKDNKSVTDNVLSENSPFFVKEAYKALRTNLVFSLTESGGKIILFTSPGAAEGKSTNCLNTAITFAETGVKVCVVDCDLRKPNLARLNNEKGNPGLSNVLVNLNSLDEVIRKSKYPNLDCIYSGNIPPNPAELLVSGKMDKTLEELASKYDYVFIDTPPINVVTDTTLLVGRASGVLLVVRQGETTKEDLSDALQQLEFVKAKVLGVLFNDFKLEQNNKYGRKHGKYHYYNYNYRYAYKLPAGDDNN